MSLVKLTRIELAILAVLQEGPISREDLASRIGLPSEEWISKVVDCCIEREWIVEKEEKLSLGSQIDMEEISDEINEMGPFGNDLFKLIDRERKKKGTTFREPLMLQDVGVNPTHTFLKKYTEEWRLLKFLILKEIFEDVERECKSILKDPAMRFTLHIWPDEYSTPDHYLHSTMKRGLLYEMQNTVFLYAEDLGGLILSVRSVVKGNYNKFMKRFLDYEPKKVRKFYRTEIPKYQEGKKDNEIKELLCYPKPEDDELRNIGGDKKEFLELIDESVGIFKTTITEISEFYRTNLELFLQYKHGNKNFLKLPNGVSDQSLEKLKKGHGVNILSYPRRRK